MSRHLGIIYSILLLCLVLLLLQYHMYIEWNNKNPLVQSNLEQHRLYIITPTYRRPEQIAQLTRLSQTLILVPNLHWLVIDDAQEFNKQVQILLKSSGLSFSYMIAPKPYNLKGKGASNRNRGIEWIRQNATNGVVYFADDDNSYALELFSEIRNTKKISLFPVGLVTQTGLSTPVTKNCKFIAFYDGWVGGRKYPIDMAGFAVSVKFLLSRPRAVFPYQPGYQEDRFLKSLEPFGISEIELLASCCTKILVWHTRTKKIDPARIIPAKYRNTNLVVLRKLIV